MARTELGGFQVGDRVIFIKKRDRDAGVVKGQTGTIVNFDANGRAGVDWDNNVLGRRFHNCAGHCEHGRGWYVYPYTLAHETPESEPFKMEDDALMDLLGV